MKSKSRRKRLKRKLKRMAATVAGAAMMSAALLPGLPAATAHASAAPVPDQPYAVTQQVVKTPKGFYTVKKKVANPVVAKQTVAQEQQTERQDKAQQAPAKEKVKTVQASPAKDKAQDQGKDTAKDVNKDSAKDPAKHEAKDKKSDKAPTEFKDVLEVKATAYAPGPHDNDQWGDLTHLGTKVRPGVIAVDPNVIPLGSRVYLEFPDGTGTYAIAEDTGGAIKGNRIDIAMGSVDQAYDFGIQNVKVYVLGK